MASTNNPDCDNLNATECILKYLKLISESQKIQQDEFNWEPISVYITSVIGLLALGLAFLTIGQAVFSNSHGRIKASEYAIGPWHKLSYSYFSWSQMGLRTVAYTPMLSIEQFRRLVKQRIEPKEPDEPMSPFEKYSRYLVRFYLKYMTTIETYAGYALWYKEWIWYMVKYINYEKSLAKGENVKRKPEKPDKYWFEKQPGGSKMQDEHFPAQWLCLLTCLPLNVPKLWHSQAVALDYIPGDLTVAPAWGPIKDLCILALLTPFGKESPVTVTIDRDSRLPHIYSAWIDFHFETHPQLGHVAVFHILQQDSFRYFIFKYSMWAMPLRLLEVQLSEACGIMKLALSDGTIEWVDQVETDEKKSHLSWAEIRRDGMRKEITKIFALGRDSNIAHDMYNVMSSDLVAAIRSSRQPFEIMFALPRAGDFATFPCNRFQLWNQIKTLLLLKHGCFVDSSWPKTLRQLAEEWTKSKTIFKGKFEWPDTITKVLNNLDQAFVDDPEESVQAETISRRDKRKQQIFERHKWDPYLWAENIRIIDHLLAQYARETVLCRKATLSLLASAAGNLLTHRPYNRAKQNKRATGGDLDDDNELRGKVLPETYTIASLKQDITYCGDTMRDLAKRKNLQDTSNIPQSYKKALLPKILAYDQPSITDTGHDDFIRAFLEVAQLWNPEPEIRIPKYVKHGIDDLIIVRSILTGLNYLYTDNDSTWILEGDENWNQVVAFL